MVAERAILEATLELLAQNGISGFSVEAVATRAGVGKATIYRRWSSKLPLVVDAITTLPELQLPDSGTLRGDFRQALGNLVTILRSSPLGRVLPQLVAEHGGDRDLDHVVGRYLERRRAPLVEIARRGLSRGELPAGCDADMLVDLLVGPIVNRLLFSRRPVGAAFIDLVIATVLDSAAGHRRGRSSARPLKR